MDKSQAQAIVKAHLPRLLWETQTQEWGIEVRYVNLEAQGWSGACSRRIDYCSAVIDLDYDFFESEEKLLDTLRHELLHVVLAPFDLYREVMTQFLEGEAAQRVESRSFRHAVEQTVRRIERMLDHGCRPCPWLAAGPEAA